ILLSKVFSNSYDISIMGSPRGPSPTSPPFYLFLRGLLTMIFYYRILNAPTLRSKDRKKWQKLQFIF
ncbi:MAG: hypothetical protein NO474_04420, partial [Methanomassiliicoccales archaeon]|nr:hypothetical protein [Methanomassiliicoccales archaeon]